MLLLLALPAACAYPLPMIETPPRVNDWTAAVDWRSAGDEAAQVLSGYLRVDTRNPPGNETLGARYLAEVLRREGIESEELEVAPGRATLIARLGPAAGKAEEGPLCLMSHIDVTTAEPEEWPAGKGPLSGAIDEQGMIWGRGALDMKGMGAIELMALIWLKRLGVPLRREVVLVAVADEEVDNLGMRQLVEQRWDRLNCSHMINEGGLGLRGVLFPDHTVFAISVAEKGVLWLKLTLHGKGGHGSTPLPTHAPARLMRLLSRLERRDPRPRMHRSFVDLFARIGRQKGGAAGFVMQVPSLVEPLAGGKLLEKPGTRVALIDTINLTGFSTGEHQPNVVPNKATATLDCRLLPGTRPEQVIAEVRRLLGDPPDLSIEVLHVMPAAESSWDDPLFEALARHSVAGRSDAAAGPVLSPGFTDSIYARARGTRAYGLVPFEVTAAEMQTMHGVGERVSVQNVRKGLRILFGAVVEVSADLSRPVAPAPPRTAPPFAPVSAGE